LILCGGYDKESAEAAIESGLTDLVAFGRPLLIILTWWNDLKMIGLYQKILKRIYFIRQMKRIY
jgi:2,4-dienoyl-CoA reductase-like NADH-dependent reductase (Old Yellow Enzyme family)